MTGEPVTEEHLTEINGLVSRAQRLYTLRKVGKPLDYNELAQVEARLKEYNVVVKGGWEALN